MKSVLALSALLFAFNIFAVEIKMCVITSDIDEEKTDLFVETNNRGEIDSVRLYKTMGNKVVSDESFPVELVIDEGIVAVERDGRDVVRMGVENFSPVTGGIVVLDHLYNGITNKRKDFKIKLVKTGNSFEVKTLEGEKINRLYVVGNRVLGKVVGIEKIKTGYTR